MSCFKIFVGISDEWDALFVLKLISFSMSVKDTVLKEKLKLHFSRIVLIFEWFWHLYFVASGIIYILWLKLHHYFLVFGTVTCLVL